jgi:hypothetical protein
MEKKWPNPISPSCCHFLRRSVIYAPQPLSLTLFFLCHLEKVICFDARLSIFLSWIFSWHGELKGSEIKQAWIKIWWFPCQFLLREEGKSLLDGVFSFYWYEVKVVLLQDKNINENILYIISLICWNFHLMIMVHTYLLKSC